MRELEWRSWRRSGGSTSRRWGDTPTDRPGSRACTSDSRRSMWPKSGGVFGN